MVHTIFVRVVCSPAISLVVRTKIKSQLSKHNGFLPGRENYCLRYLRTLKSLGSIVTRKFDNRKGKLAKTNFSQRSLPSYNLIKPQQSTFKAARPQILVRRTRPKNDLARKEPVRLGVKGKTTKPSLLQVPRIFSVHKIWLNGPSLRGFGAREHAWPNAVRRCCWALIMAGGPLHGGHN